jgi:hypothetical protein
MSGECRQAQQGAGCAADAERTRRWLKWRRLLRLYDRRRRIAVGGQERTRGASRLRRWRRGPTMECRGGVILFWRSKSLVVVSICARICAMRALIACPSPRPWIKVEAALEQHGVGAGVRAPGHLKRAGVKAPARTVCLLAGRARRLVAELGSSLPGFGGSTYLLQEHVHWHVGP